MKILLSLGAAASLALAAAAPAAAVTAAGPLPLGDFTGVSITETPGEYFVTNNSTAAVVVAFGVTNPVSVEATIGGFPSGFVNLNGNPDGANFWDARLLTENDWASYQPFFGFFDGQVGLTMEDIFGAWDFGTDVVNWYEWSDASGLANGGGVYSNFLFAGPTASEAFGVGFDNSGTGSIFDLGDITGTPPRQPTNVPLPAAGWMLIAGAAALVGARRRKG